MQIKGIITAAMPVASGTSKSGKEWKRASYVLTYDKSNEQYPKSILFDVMGDRIEQLNLQQSKEYEVEIDFSTREYNGRIYMSASAWKATATATTTATEGDTGTLPPWGGQKAYPEVEKKMKQGDTGEVQDDKLPF